MFNTLDHVSSKLVRNEVAACVFDEFGRCSTNREFGILCRNHADQILGIALIRDTVVTSSNEQKLHKLVCTEGRQVFVPFPYKLETLDDGTLDATRKPCLNRDELQTKTAEFVTQMNLQSPDLQHRVVSALMSLFIDGSVFFANMPRASLNFQVFCTPNVKAYLQKRWENCSIYVKYTPTGGRTTIGTYPMDKMPLFYQIILSYCTLSNNVLASSTNDQNLEYSDTLQPNIILNADRFQFEYINNKEPNPLFLHRVNSTFASPLILAGSQIHKHKIELFKQNAIFYDYSFENIPGFCTGVAPGV